MVLGLGVVGLVGLAAATSVALVRAREHRKECTQTRLFLEDLSRRVRHTYTATHRDQLVAGPLRTDSPIAGDEDGNLTLLRNYCDGCEHGFPRLRLKHEVLDVWGNRIHYRCPSPLHPEGWDLYSIGPNGIDEGGYGDDLVAVGDLAPVGSTR